MILLIEEKLHFWLKYWDFIRSLNISFLLLNITLNKCWFLSSSFFCTLFNNFSHFFIFLLYFYRGEDTMTDKMFNDIMDSIINNTSEEVEIIIEKLMIILWIIIMIIRSKENDLIHSIVLFALIVIKIISLNLVRIKKLIFYNY